MFVVSLEISNIYDGDEKTIPLKVFKNRDDMIAFKEKLLKDVGTAMRYAEDDNLEHSKKISKIKGISDVMKFLYDNEWGEGIDVIFLSNTFHTSYNNIMD